ncbi:DUF6600 domain-containing protein [Roseateles violae]|uniref:FecR family protein n=1 Tax=Roseateles violae TaxID=3058042 RepID=A0ABT8DZ75_9BURK|nr:DUF6600 domain-containing protein [Pelomonas sp. PFR6]MDN3922864.1 hypothetical protein [Pelomonas sp. PFR6]
MNAAAPQTSHRIAGLWRRALWFQLALALLIGLARPAAAQSELQMADPPARVGRIAEVYGDAWLFDTEAKDWVRVSRNQTIGQGDRLRTDERSRVALRIGSTSVWLDERSDLEFTLLDEGQVLLSLDKGDLGLRLRSPDAATDYKIRTREGTLIPENKGLYRIEQIDRGARAFAWAGRLRFESSRGSEIAPTLLEPGEQAEFWWAGGPRVERQRIEGNNDGFADWMLSQDQREAGIAVAESQRYVSPEMTGAEELDRHGRWEQSPEYGAVWTPYQVAVDWAPYRYGHWAWTRYWGWAWVDDAPWGFAPFHYGRWVMWGGRWCWAPGRYVARPVYSPALVAWVGTGAVSVGVSVGGRPPPPRYGWYPLAPRENYVPAYRHTPTYMRRINGDHDPVTVERPHRNRDVAGAISYLPAHTGPARPLPPQAVPREQLRPMPAPPPRNEFVGMARPDAGNARPAPPTMGWRSNEPGGRRGDRDRGERAGPPRPERTPPAQQLQVQPQQPQQELPPMSLPERAQRGLLPQQQAQQPQAQPVPQQQRPWQAGRGDQQPQPQREAPTVVPRAMPPNGAVDLMTPNAQRQMERAQERLQERSAEQQPQRQEQRQEQGWRRHQAERMQQQQQEQQQQRQEQQRQEQQQAPQGIRPQIQQQPQPYSRPVEPPRAAQAQPQQQAMPQPVIAPPPQPQQPSPQQQHRGRGGDSNDDGNRGSRSGRAGQQER